MVHQQFHGCFIVKLTLTFFFNLDTTITVTFDLYEEE